MKKRIDNLDEMAMKTTETTQRKKHDGQLSPLCAEHNQKCWNYRFGANQKQ